jgi:hypothetical protein
MGTPPTKDARRIEQAEPAIERLFEGAADPVEPNAQSAPTGAAAGSDVTQEESDA